MTLIGRCCNCIPHVHCRDKYHFRRKQLHWIKAPTAAVSHSGPDPGTRKSTAIFEKDASAWVALAHESAKFLGGVPGPSGNYYNVNAKYYGLPTIKAPALTQVDHQHPNPLTGVTWDLRSPFPSNNRQPFFNTGDAFPGTIEDLSCSLHEDWDTDTSETVMIGDDGIPAPIDLTFPRVPLAIDPANCTQYILDKKKIEADYVTYYCDETTDGVIDMLSIDPASFAFYAWGEEPGFNLPVLSELYEQFTPCHPWKETITNTGWFPTGFDLTTYTSRGVDWKFINGKTEVLLYASGSQQRSSQAYGYRVKSVVVKKITPAEVIPQIRASGATGWSSHGSAGDYSTMLCVKVSRDSYDNDPAFHDARYLNKVSPYVYNILPGGNGAQTTNCPNVLATVELSFDFEPMPSEFATTSAFIPFAASATLGTADFGGSYRDMWRDEPDWLSPDSRESLEMPLDRTPHRASFSRHTEWPYNYTNPRVAAPVYRPQSGFGGSVIPVVLSPETVTYERVS